MPKRTQRERRFKIATSEYKHDSDSSDDIMKDIHVSNGVMSAEPEIMRLYKEKFNVDPLDRSLIFLTSEQRIERCAQNIAFWQKLLREYNENDFNFQSSYSNLYY